MHLAVKHIFLLSSAVIFRGGSFAAAQDDAGNKVLLPIKGEMLRGVSNDVTDAYHGTLLAQARHLNDVNDDVCASTIKSGGECKQDAEDCHCDDGLTCETNICEVPARPSSGTLLVRITTGDEDGNPSAGQFTVGTTTGCLKAFTPTPGLGAITYVTLNSACPLQSLLPLTMSATGDDGWRMDTVEVKLDDGRWKVIASGEVLSDNGISRLKSRDFYLNNISNDVCAFPIASGGECKQGANDCHCDDGLSCDANTCKTPALASSGILTVKITTGDDNGSQSLDQFTIGTSTGCLKAFTPKPGLGEITVVTLNSACPIQSLLPLTMSATGTDGWFMDKVEVQLDGGTWNLIASDEKLQDNNGQDQFKSHDFYLNNINDDVCVFPIENGGDCEWGANDCHCNDGLSCQANTCKSGDDVICLESTAIIMEAVDSSYNDKDATWQAVTGVERTITDDFTTNQVLNSKYESACIEEGGTYEELSYKAECNPAGGDQVTLHVIRQPRCYAQSCAAATERNENLPNLLFYAFTLEPTAERASEKHDSTSRWTCTGALNDAPTTTGCEVATDLMNTEIDGTIDKNPSVSDIKFLILLPTKGKKVQYKGDASATLGERCDLVSGIFMEKNFKMTCTPGEGSGGSEAAFEVTDFPLCLASVCDIDQAAIDGAIATHFRDEMLDSDNLDNSQDWTCTRSVAVKAASIRVSVGTVLALWWYLI
jgi:hypothetical protein